MMAEAHQEADIQVSVLQKIAGTADKDVQFLLHSLGLQADPEKYLTIRQFREQIIVVAASEAADLLIAAQRARIAELERDLAAANNNAIKAWAERDQYLESNVKLVKMVRDLRAQIAELEETNARLMDTVKYQHDAVQRVTELEAALKDCAGCIDAAEAEGLLE